MKELLNKIRNADKESSPHCELAAEAYEKIGKLLEDYEKQAAQVVNGRATHDLEADLDALESLLSELEKVMYKLDGQEIARIKTKLGNDFAEMVELWKEFGLMSESYQVYKSDYGEFEGQDFAFPLWRNVIGSIKPEHFKLYQKMEKEGLEPKLQITPIAFQIETLARKIDAKRGLPKIGTRDNTYVLEIDKDLSYDPDSIKAIKEGKAVEITGGKSKSEWINENAGLLIDIVAMKQNLAIDPDVERDEHGEINSTSIKAEKLLDKARRNGFTPMSCESYLLAQMRALMGGKPLDTASSSLLLDSNFDDHNTLIRGCWNQSLIDVRGTEVEDQYERLGMRETVRIKII